MRPAEAPFPVVLEAARQREGWAWSRLYHSVAPQVLGYLRGKGAVDPDDVMGEVFLAVARGIHRFDGDESGFRSWVFTVAHSRMVDDYRRRASRPVSDGPELLEPLGGSADTAAEAMEALVVEDLVRLFAGLTPDQRAVLELRYLADLSLEETARVVDKPLGAVKALQRRALGTLRQALAVAGVSG